MCSTGSMRMIKEQTQTRQTKTGFEKAEKDSKKYKVEMESLFAGREVE